MDVLDALASTAHLADDRTVDSLLRELNKVPGVQKVSIPTADVRSGRHGVCVVTWLQEGRSLSREGHTLDVALRRALRAAGDVSAKADSK